ncbi:MAG: tetraacyldisaccharide 4'-kinase [Flavobacteriales bacterium]|nr:tetraacyldisaccharide 4'-kinase [Flavobacteriales bacterium]
MLSKLRIFLLPFSIIYGVVIWLRHQLFDLHILKSRKGDLPTLVIGNIHAGGTGKTPHAEFFIRKLSAHFHLAFLSRGYGRKTRGYVFANQQSTAEAIGDEPMQIHRRFPQLEMAVCEDRLKGLTELQKSTSANLVILDDAFQHRRLQPDFSVVLMPYARPWWKDILLPAGNLRDSATAAGRADAIVVSKCPDFLTLKERESITNWLQPYDNQIIAFSSIEYGQPYQIHGKTLNINKQSPIFGFAGIAETTDFEKKIRGDYNLLGFRKFADHHIFSRNDIESLRLECGNFANVVPALITTEKDAERLSLISLPNDLAIFVLPIEIVWLDGEKELMDAILNRFIPGRKHHKK